MAATVRAKIPSRMPHDPRLPPPDAPLEECELVVRYLDEELNQQAPETLLCLEFVIRYLRDWGETHADAAFQKARSTRRWSSSCRASACSSTARCRWRSS